MNTLAKIKSHLLHYTWDIAFIDCSDDILSKSLKELHPRVVRNPYKDKWFADPFILAVDDGFITLLAEEFDKHVGRGRIAELKIEKKTNTIVDCHIVLDLPTHLSFPAIYRRDSVVYVHPENWHSGKSVLYTYDSVKKQLIPHKTLVEEQIADAVIRKFGNTYYMFATVAPDFNGKALQVYKADEFDGRYEHCDTLTFDADVARMAGDFIQIGDSLYRPAQDCGKGQYGRGVVLFSFDREDYHKTAVVNELKSSCVKYAGVHTVNDYKGIRVIDLKKYDYPVLYAIKESLK